MATAFACGTVTAQVLEEVVVTAQKRNEKIQDVPLAIQAISQATLAGLRFDTLEKYARLVPTLDFDGTNTSGSQSIRLRGVAPNVGDPTVAFYIDETPLQDNDRIGTVNPRIFDIERIEVLRGPQGNIYGASSMGGTIKVVTRQAQMNRSEGSIDTAVSNTENGSYNVDVKGMINLPLSPDVLALRVAASFTNESDFIANLSRFPPPVLVTPVPNPRNEASETRKVGGLESASARITLNFQPNERLSIVPTLFVQSSTIDGMPEVDPAFGSSVPTQSRFVREGFEDRLTLSSLVVTADLSMGQILSATSYADRRNVARFDFTGFLNGIFGPFSRGDADYILPMTNSRKMRQFTQELRFASSWQFPVQVLAGLFYTDQKRPFSQSLTADGAVAAGVLPMDLLFVQNRPAQREEFAVFTNLTYALRDRFEFQAGGRWFDIDKEDLRLADGLFNGGSFTSQTFASRDKDTNYAFSASVKLTQDHLLYARAAEGFRAGFGYVLPPRTAACDAGLVILGLDPNNLDSQVDSDSLWNYEIGAKTTWLDQRLRLNASAFHIVFDDIQQSVAIPGCGFGISDNVGKASSDGIELEIQASPVEGLNLGIAAGYVDAKLESDAPTIGGNAGERLARVPKWTLSTTGDYSFPLPGGQRRMFIRGNHRYVSSRSTNYGTLTTGPTPTLELGSYSIIDAAIGVAGDSWETSLFVDNATNERAEYNIEVFRRTPAFSINRARTVGVSLKKRF